VGQQVFAIQVMDANGATRRGLLGNARDPAWSPDGRQIAFASDRAGSFEIYVMNADGSGQTRLTTGGGANPSWSPRP
jgi:TolB protein